MSYIHKQRLAALYIEDNGTAADAAENDADAKQARADKAAADVADRRKQIMQSDAAQGRQLLAAHLADETDMSPADVAAILGKAPRSSSSSAPSNSQSNRGSAADAAAAGGTDTAGEAEGSNATPAGSAHP
jgi:hypothetical protein